MSGCLACLDRLSLRAVSIQFHAIVKRTLAAQDSAQLRMRETTARGPCDLRKEHYLLSADSDALRVEPQEECHVQAHRVQEHKDYLPTAHMLRRVDTLLRPRARQILPAPSPRDESPKGVVAGHPGGRV